VKSRVAQKARPFLAARLQSWRDQVHFRKRGISALVRHFSLALGLSFVPVGAATRTILFLSVLHLDLGQAPIGSKLVSSRPRHHIGLFRARIIFIICFHWLLTVLT
jgi:hypothetical protein